MSQEQDSFNPSSKDAMFATILERMNQQDKASEAYRATLRSSVDQILAEARKTNGRVTGLEHWRTSIKAKVAVASAVISGGVAAAVWLMERWMGQ